MGASLTKGANVSLSRTVPDLAMVTIGLGWDVAGAEAAAGFDLDASAIICGEDGKALSDAHFVYYNNLTSPDGAITHAGDNTTGAGQDDDEQITVDVTALAPQVASVVFVVSIHDADLRRQTFGQVSDAFIRVVDQATEREMCRYELTEDASAQTAMVFGALYRRSGEWKFRAIGQGYDSGLAGIAGDYGISLD